GQERTWCKGSDDLREVEWQLVRPGFIFGSDQRHIAVAAPTFQIPIEVLGKGIESAVRYQGLDAGVEDGRKHGVVAARRMADAADPLWIDFGERLQQVNRPHIIPNRLQAAALEYALAEVEWVLAKARIVGRERDVAALCQVCGIVQIG